MTKMLTVIKQQRARIEELEGIIVQAYENTPPDQRAFAAVPVPQGALLATLVTWNLTTQALRAQCLTLSGFAGERDRFKAALDDLYLCCFSHGHPVLPSRHDVLAIIEQARKGKEGACPTNSDAKT
jgi:hypothetical protein